MLMSVATEAAAINSARRTGVTRGVNRRVEWPGLQQVGQRILAAGVQDLANRRGAPADAELDRVAGTQLECAPRPYR